jgi:hypothetical protein
MPTGSSRAKPFERYGIEQQAEIARDAFLARKGIYRAAAGRTADYAALLPFTTPREAA